ncbi:TPA: hypothetical protein ACWX6S_004447 [Pseudomonas aeruginosa]
MTTSKIQMDQIRSTSATVTGENIRAGSQKKSSLSQAEGLQGASPDATCTCPSGDGSLVHPCPAHPASVEQAGGDERERLVNEWKAARAWKPSPAQAEQAEAERLDWPSALLDVAVLQEALTSRDSDERMKNMDAGEVIRRAFGKLTEIRAQHERIVGALRADNAKLSEDLNRLSIIRARLNLRLDFALDKISKLESRWPHGESPEERFEHYISNTIDRAPEPLRRLGNWLSHVLDEDQWTTAERMLTGACVAAEERAAAQTQHSVPELEQSRSALTEAQMRRIYENSTEAENERLGFAAFARLMRRAEAVHQIAAAPGKEGV